MNYLRIALRECRDYLEYFIIPAMAVIMPWWLAIRWFRLVANVPFLYRGPSNLRMEGAKQVDLLNESPASWQKKTKIAMMIDLADMFILLVWGKRHIQRYVTDDFSDKLLSQQLIATPHYGTGILAYRLLADKKISTAMLIDFYTDGYRALNFFSRFRLWSLQKAGVRVFDPRDIQVVRQALRDECSILFMPDLPQNASVRSYQILTDGGKLNVASRFFELAEKRHLPVLYAIFDIDLSTGRRHFTAEMQVQLNAEQYAQCFAEKTINAIKQQSYLWHMTVVASQVLQPNKQ